MAIISAKTLGDDVLALTVDHDPSSEATDCPAGSIIMYGEHWYRKCDDGSTTNVLRVGGIDTEAHKDRHKSGGSDAFTAADVLEAPVKRIQEQGTPIILTLGTVADGQVLKRSGSQLVGADFMPASSLKQLTWYVTPAFNGTYDMMGWHEQTDDDASLTSASPVTASVPPYHGHYVLDVASAAGLPFTIRVTGTTVDESTGTTTPGDTEDIAITADGYYQTTKSFVDAAEFSILEASKSCTLDIYRTSYWDYANRDFYVDGVRVEFCPSGTTWDMTIQILTVNNDGSLSSIIDKTLLSSDVPPFGERNYRSKWKRTNMNVLVEGSAGAGIIVRADQTALYDFYVEVRFHE